MIFNFKPKYVEHFYHVGISILFHFDENEYNFVTYKNVRVNKKSQRKILFKKTIKCILIVRKIF